MHTCSVLCAASSFITTPSHSGWFKTLAETVKPSLGSKEHTWEGHEKILNLDGLNSDVGSSCLTGCFLLLLFLPFCLVFFLFIIFLSQWQAIM